MTPPPIIAVVGPSGVGKDTVMAGLAHRDPGFRIARRVITRDPDAGGEAFEAVTQDSFARLQKQGAFVLSWQAHGLSYGIPQSILSHRDGSRAVLVNLSRRVLIQAQDVLAPLVVLSLTADAALLARRLSDRGRESAQDRAQRLDRAALDLPQGLQHVIEIDNSGPLDQTLTAILARLQPESV